MTTQIRFPISVPALAPEATGQVETLSQQQATAALFALANRKGPQSGGRSQPRAGLTRNRRAAARPGLGDARPYRGSAHDAIRRGKLANLHSGAGRCPTCGTRAWSCRDD